MDLNRHWLVTTDGRSAHLFACQRLPGGGLHLEPKRSIANVHESEHEHQRPAFAGGAERRGSIARSSAHPAPHAVTPGRTADEELHRFAREVNEWLASTRRELGEGPMALFAPPHFLGVLRAHANAEDAREMHEGDFAKFRPAELAAHPVIVKAVCRP